MLGPCAGSDQSDDCEWSRSVILVLRIFRWTIATTAFSNHIRRETTKESTHHV